MAFAYYGLAWSVYSSVLRCEEKRTVRVTAMEEKHDSDGLAELIPSEGVHVPELRILGINVTAQNGKSLPELRVASGI